MNARRPVVVSLVPACRFKREDCRSSDRCLLNPVIDDEISSVQKSLFRLTVVWLALVFSMCGSVLAQSTDRERLPPAWLPEVDELFVAQDYPSRHAAALSAGRHLRSRMASLVPPADGITVVPGEPPVSAEDLVAVTTSLQAEFPDEEVRVASSIAEVPKGEVGVSVYAGEQDAAFCMEVLFPASEHNRQASFTIPHDDATWITGEEELGGNQRIARSARLATVEEAKRQCREDAVSLVLPKALEQAKRSLVEKGPLDELPFDLRAELDSRIGSIQADQVSQAFLMQDGSHAYRVAMRLDLDRLPDVVKVICTDSFTPLGEGADMRPPGASRSHPSYVGRLMALIGLLTGVTMVYCLLDGLTHGFFAGWIKAGVSVFGLIGLAILFLATRG